MKNNPHNIYIHVPFCMSKCNYCAFFSHACAAPDWEKYTSDICSEIVYWAQKLGKIDVPTIFFGGGTPSLMPTKCFAQIINTIHDNFNVDTDAEITLESNPGTLDRGRLGEFAQFGVNRLSVGVQSLNDDKLKFLGRRHNADDAIRLLDDAHNMGLRVSGDFIYGLPGENVDDVINTCKQINQLGLQHCSMYELTIEAGTPFGRMNLDMPDNDTMAQMYMAISDNIAPTRYEVSNYAVPGNECRHNQNVWDGDAYIGIGIGAAGRVFIDGTWYEQMGGGAQFDPMTTDARAIEKVITGMRTIRGCKLTPDVNHVINTDWINANSDLVKIQNNRVAVTDSGMLVLDNVITKMVK